MWSKLSECRGGEEQHGESSGSNANAYTYAHADAGTYTSRTSASITLFVSEPKWWMQPQGLAAAATILVMILGFFYVRERQMWEQALRITTLEMRGEKAIVRIDGKMEQLDKAHMSLRDKVVELEYRVRDVERITP
jgi:hypothetical protein